MTVVLAGWPVVARHQLRLVVRDRRLMLLGAAMLMLIAVAVVAATARDRTAAAERRAAQAAEARAWASLPPGNPHAAGHFGRYVFAPVPPLSALDGGLLDSLGAVLPLQAHERSPAVLRRIDGRSVVEGFARIDAATVLQRLLPLLLIAAAFGTFAGPNAEASMKQELAAGARPGSLLGGRLIGLALLVPALLLPVLIGGLMLGGTGEIARLLLLLLGYALYLFAILAATLGVSAWAGSTRTALVTMLGFGALATMALPRIVPAIAEAAHPTLSAAALEKAVDEELLHGADGKLPAQAHNDAIKAALLARYHVETVEELPVNFGGAAFFAGEQRSAALYERRTAELFAGYAAQAKVQRWFALVSPLLALRPWSAALAGTDLPAHERLLGQAERYRYGLVQALNRDIFLHFRPDDDDYAANMAAITRGRRFESFPEPVAAVWAREWPDLAILAGWTAAAIGFALAGIRRRSRRL